MLKSRLDTEVCTKKIRGVTFARQPLGGKKLVAGAAFYQSGRLFSPVQIRDISTKPSDLC